MVAALDIDGLAGLDTVGAIAGRGRFTEERAGFVKRFAMGSDLTLACETTTEEEEEEEEEEFTLEAGKVIATRSANSTRV